jgi:hypothetical protein
LVDFVIHQSLLSFLPSWKTNVAEIRPLRCTAKSIKFYMCKGYLHKHELSVIHTYNRILCCTTDFFCFTTKVCVVTQNIVLCCTTDFFVLYAKYCVVDQILCCTTKFCVVWANLCPMTKIDAFQFESHNWFLCRTIQILCRATQNFVFGENRPLNSAIH